MINWWPLVARLCPSNVNVRVKITLLPICAKVPRGFFLSHQSLDVAWISPQICIKTIRSKRSARIIPYVDLSFPGFDHVNCPKENFEQMRLSDRTSNQVHTNPKPWLSPEMWTLLFRRIWTKNLSENCVITKPMGMTCLFDRGSVRAFSFVDDAANFNLIRLGVLAVNIVAWHMNDDGAFLGVVYIRLVVRLRFSYYMWLWCPCFLKVNVSACFSSFRSLPLSFTCGGIRSYLTNYQGIRLSLIKLVYYEWRKRPSVQVFQDWMSF